MKRIALAAASLLLFCGLAAAGGGIDVFLSDLNVQARADSGGFSARVSAQFGVPVPQVQQVIARVSSPADAFMVFQLGQWTNNPPNAVLPVYQKNRGKGWGVIAKSMGIKPGSPEFHALKRGDLALTGTPGGSPGSGHGKGHGKGKGHGRGGKD